METYRLIPKDGKRDAQNISSIVYMNQSCRNSTLCSDVSPNISVWILRAEFLQAWPVRLSILQIRG